MIRPSEHAMGTIPACLFLFLLITLMIGCGIDNTTSASPKATPVNGSISFEEKAQDLIVRKEGGALIVEVLQSSVKSPLKVNGVIELKTYDGKQLSQKGSALLRIIPIEGQMPSLSILQSGGAGIWTIGLRPQLTNSPAHPEGYRLYYTADDMSGGAYQPVYLDIDRVIIP